MNVFDKAEGKRCPTSSTAHSSPKHSALFFSDSPIWARRGHSQKYCGIALRGASPQSDVFAAFTSYQAQACFQDQVLPGVWWKQWENPHIPSLFFSVCTWPSAKVSSPAIPHRPPCSSMETEGTQGCMAVYLERSSQVLLSNKKQTLYALASKGLFIFLVLWKKNTHEMWMEIKTNNKYLPIIIPLSDLSFWRKRLWHFCWAPQTKQETHDNV